MKYKEALEIVKNNKIDLILADINMPKMNGLDFVLQAKQQYRLFFTSKEKAPVLFFPSPLLQKGQIN